MTFRLFVISLLAATVSASGQIDATIEPAPIEANAFDGYPIAGGFELTNSGASEIAWSIAGARVRDWTTSVPNRFRTHWLNRELVASIQGRVAFNSVPIGSLSQIAEFQAPTIFGPGGGNRIHVDGSDPLSYRGQAGGIDYQVAGLGEGVFLFVAQLGDETSVGTSSDLANYEGGVEALEFQIGYQGFDYRCAASVRDNGSDFVQLWITDSPTSTHAANPDPLEDENDSISGLAPGSRVALLTFAIDGSEFGIPEAEAIVRELLGLIGPLRIMVNPASGTIAAGGSQTVSFTSAPVANTITDYELVLDLIADGTTEQLLPAIDISFVPDLIDVDQEPILLTRVGALPFTSATLELASSLPAVEPNWTASSPDASVVLSAGSGGTPGTLTVTGTGEVGEHGNWVSTHLTITPESGAPIEIPVRLSYEKPSLVWIEHTPMDPHVYAIHSYSGTLDDAFVVKVDPLTGNLIDAAPAAPYSVSVFDISINRASPELYVASGSRVRVFDLPNWPEFTDIPTERVYHVAPAGANHLVAVSQSELLMFDARTGEMIDSRPEAETPTSIGSTVDGSALFYGNSDWIRRGSMASEVPFAELRGTWPSDNMHRVTVCDHAERIFFGRHVFDENLNPLGVLQDRAIAVSPRGELVVTQTQVLRLSNGGMPVIDLPFTSFASAILGDAERLLTHDRVTGEIVSLPLRDYSVSRVEFGHLPLGTTASATATVTNTGVEELVLTGAGAGDIELSPFPVTIAPGASAELTATYTSTMEGIRTGAVGLVDAFIESPAREVAFSATGTFDPASLPGYSEWRGARFAADPSLGDPLADPDGDGLANFAEFLFDLNPHAPGDPDSHLLTIEGGDLTFVRSSLNAARIAVEQSGSLVSWQPAGDLTEATIQDLGGGFERVSYRLPENGEAGARFYRAVARFRL